MTKWHHEQTAASPRPSPVTEEGSLNRRAARARPSRLTARSRSFAVPLHLPFQFPTMEGCDRLFGAW